MSTRFTELHKRIEGLPPRMQEFYFARLAALATRDYSPAAMAEFERKLAIAEDLSKPRTTPAVRLRGGRQ